MFEKQTLKLLKSHACCGGRVKFFSHQSVVLGLEARFGVFLPSQLCREDGAEPWHAVDMANMVQKVPAVYVLAGLTCTEETFLTKSNIVRFAAEYGLALIAPDTSPRGADIAGEDKSYDLGTGAGYYVDATATPWSSHYRMASYVGKELPALVEQFLPVDGARCGIMGHSMGGAGALGLALRDSEKWKSVSAFAPIASPSQVEWGQKATLAYFDGDASQWAAYDPTLLLHSGKRFPGDILVDQGMDDQFLAQYLRPELLEHAAEAAGQALTLRRHAGYDHSYWFIQSFISDHIRHHAGRLMA